MSARKSRTVSERGGYFVNVFDPEGNEFSLDCGLLRALRPVGLDHQLDFRNFHRVPVAVRDLVLEITEPVTVPWSLRRVLMLERFFQSMPVVGATIGALGPVGHDDVRVTVRLFTMRPVRVLDHLDEPMDVRIRAKVMTVNVLVIVPVRHGPMLIRRWAVGQTAAG